jgi:hypothetical protein
MLSHKLSWKFIEFSVKYLAIQLKIDRYFVKSSFEQVHPDRFGEVNLLQQVQMKLYLTARLYFFEC